MAYTSLAQTIAGTLGPRGTDANRLWRNRAHTQSEIAKHLSQIKKPETRKRGYSDIFMDEALQASEREGKRSTMLPHTIACTKKTAPMFGNGETSDDYKTLVAGPYLEVQPINAIVACLAAETPDPALHRRQGLTMSELDITQAGVSVEQSKRFNINVCLGSLLSLIDSEIQTRLDVVRSRDSESYEAVNEAIVPGKHYGELLITRKNIVCAIINNAKRMSISQHAHLEKFEETHHKIKGGLFGSTKFKAGEKIVECSAKCGHCLFCHRNNFTNLINNMRRGVCSTQPMHEVIAVADPK